MIILGIIIWLMKLWHFVQIWQLNILWPRGRECRIIKIIIDNNFSPIYWQADVFEFPNEVVYPTDHVFSDLKKMFLLIFHESREKTKQTFCIPKGRLNVPTTLVHMLMPSAQRRADNQCCRCIPPPRYQLAATALIPPSKTWECVV